MKKLLLVFFLFSGYSNLFGSGLDNPETEPTIPMPGTISLKQFLSLTPREYQKLTGRKLKLKEKIGLKILQWKFKRKMKDQASPEQLKRGRLSLIFGLIAVVLVCVALVVPAGILVLISLGSAIAGFVLGISSLKGNSNGPGIIGLVFSSLVLFLFLLFIAAILGSATYD